MEPTRGIQEFGSRDPVNVPPEKPPSAGSPIRKAFWILAFALFLCLAVPTVRWLIQEVRRSRYLNLFEKGRFLESSKQALEFLEQYPRDDEAIFTLEVAAEKQVDVLLGQGKTGEAREFVQWLDKQSPGLSRVSLAEMKVFLRELDGMVQAGKTEEALKKIADRVATDPRNPALLKEALHFHCKNGISRAATDEYCFRLIEVDPLGTKADQEVLFRVSAFLATCAPEDGDENHRELITRHLFDQVRPELEKYLYFPGRENESEYRNPFAVWCLRRNALQILGGRGIPIDLFRFHLLSVLYPPPRLPEVKIRRGLVESIRFLGDAVASGPTPGQLAQVPEEIASFPLVDMWIFEPGTPFVRVASGLLAKQLAPILRPALTSDDVPSRRINAAITLEGRCPSYPERALIHARGIAAVAERPTWNAVERIIPSIEFWEGFLLLGSVKDLPAGTFSGGPADGTASPGTSPIRFTGAQDMLSKVDSSLEQLEEFVGEQERLAQVGFLFPVVMELGMVGELIRSVREIPRTGNR